MKNKPKALVFLAAVLVGIALSFPLQIMYLYGHGISEFSAIWAKVSITNQIVMLLCLVNAYLLMEVNKAVIYTTPVLILAVIFNNWWVAHAGFDFSMGTTVLASSGFAFLHGLMLAPDARRVLTRPNERWWRTAKRKRVEVPTFVSPWVEGSFSTTTFDLSSTGAFLKRKVNLGGEDRLPLTIKANDFIELRISIDGIRHIRCTAQVVRVAEPNGQYPGGIGIQFTKMSYQDQQYLNRYLNTH